VWSKQFGTTSFVCNGRTQNWGVEGTAALDRPRNRIYVPDGTNNVHALDLSTGAEAPGWPVNIAPLTNHDFIHVGMNYNPSNGMLYAATSSTCDISPWYGRLTAINTNTATIVRTFFPGQGTSGGSIWGFGGASISPSSNNVFIATGNEDDINPPQYGHYSEHIIELSADLTKIIAQNHPPNMPVMEDSDFGTTPLLFQPIGCPPLLAAVNKSGAFLLYNRTNIKAGPIQMIDMAVANNTASFRQTPAYDPVTNEVYIALPSTFGIYQPGLGAFSMRSDCTLNPTPAWNAVFGPDGATTTLETTRSAVTVANGVAYVGGYSDKTMYAFSAATGTKLWSTPLNGWGIVGPVVVNGRLYVSDASGTISAWVP
jgi:outer membrane protein assembly factor BamB